MYRVITAAKRRDTYNSRYENAGKVIWKIIVTYRGPDGKWHGVVKAKGTAATEEAAVNAAQKRLRRMYPASEFDVQNLNDVAEYYEDSYNKYDEEANSYLTRTYEPSVLMDGWEIEEPPVVTLDFIE